MSEAADWLVVVDTVNIADESLGKRYRALQVLYHPHFNTFNNDYDVGLLRTITDMDMKGNKQVAPSVSKAWWVVRYLQQMQHNYYFVFSCI